MRFCSAENYDAISVGSYVDEVCDSACLAFAESVRLHRRLDRRPDLSFDDAEAMKYFGLAISRCTPVATHRRYNDRLAAFFANCIRNTLKQFDESAHAAAAGGDGDSRAKTNF